MKALPLADAWEGVSETLVLPYLGLAADTPRFHVLPCISPERGLPKATFSLFGGA